MSRLLRIVFFYLLFTVGVALSMASASASGATNNGDESDIVAAEGAEKPLELDLAMAMERALEQSPSLQATAELVAQAEAKVKQARSLYFPQVDAEITVNYTWLPENLIDRGEQVLNTAEQGVFQVQRALAGTGITGLSNQETRALRRTLRSVDSFIDRAESELENPQDSYSLRLTVAYLLFDGFGRRYTNAMARFGQEEGEAAYREARRLLLSAVAEAFFVVQLTRENLKIAESDRDFNARILKDARVRREFGKGSTSDVLNFEVRQRAAETRVLQLRRDYEAAQLALGALLGEADGKLPDGTIIAPLAPLGEGKLALPDEETAIDYALVHRPDASRRSHALQRAEAMVGQKRAAYGPTVGVGASYGNTLSRDFDLDSDDFTTTVALNLSYSLYTGGRRKAEVQEAKAAQREAERRLTETELRVMNEVRTALLDLRTSQEQLQLQEESAALVERNRDLVTEEYEAGKTMLVRLNQAQRDLVEAQAQLALARVSLHDAWVQFKTATGSILTDYLEPVGVSLSH